MRNIEDCQLIQLPKILDERGNLSFIEGERHIPFKIQRAYWVYDVPGGETREGGHAYQKLQEFIVALSGSFDIVVNDNKEKKVITLNRSYFGLYVPNMIWRRIENFSTNAFCLVLASLPYDEDDYIHDIQQYRQIYEAQTKL